MDLGDFLDDATVHFLWDSMGLDGASITRTVDGQVRVYKVDNAIETTVGITNVEDFDGLTGVHSCTIVTTDSFYTRGSNYNVVINATTVDGRIIQHTLARFSIEKNFVSPPGAHQLIVIAG